MCTIKETRVLLRTSVWEASADPAISQQFGAINCFSPSAQSSKKPQFNWQGLATTTKNSVTKISR